ncbi:DUF6233 domain-containing protein [Streptomyces zhihengii]
MTDLPPDLPRLRTLETWIVLELRQVQAQIAAVEQREREQQVGLERRPPTPAWVIETGIGADKPRLYVHAGGCHMAGRRVHPATREEAASAVADGVEACSHCGADNQLGTLD